ncbi:hypothetical protein ACIA8K_22470 [Catenuloplanes sp. NPDC051500]|uniref:hypothetical protein n=1 Tax=Catenuloplanes sp. NPDC051500 TaxID=3363959 RepID=UPI0037B4A22C
MTDGPHIIELGAPGAEPAVERRRPVPPPALALIVVVAAAGGAFLGAAWGHDRAVVQRREVDAATVKLLVYGDGQSMSVGGNLLQVQLTGGITLINAGPMPVEIETFRGSAPGITLTGIERRRWIDPGVSSTLQAMMVVNCNPGITLTPVQVDAWVRTDDGESRETRLPLSLKGTIWDDAVSKACTVR